MRQAATAQKISYPGHAWAANYRSGGVACDWTGLREQLLNQWNRLSRADLDSAGPDRHRIAVLVQRKYGIPARLIENYLANLERTLPVL